MLKNGLIWGLAAAILSLSAVQGMAGTRAHTRPYTIEKVCDENGRPCHLHMIYAPGHDPAGPVPDGYWYNTSFQRHHYKAHEHHAGYRKYGSVYVSYHTYKHWYKHPPEHRY